MYKIARKIFFCFNPEKIHDFVIYSAAKFRLFYPLAKLIYNPHTKTEVTINDLVFRNPLGLAAGLDKDAEAIKFWDVLGFSHIEVGTVTPFPQPGNEKPRLFRLIKNKALLNRMGFNNNGALEMKLKISKIKKSLSKDFIVGVNIGKNKNTPLENAKEDYAKCIEILFDEADYFTVNISSPNTEGLRELQSEQYLEDLLGTIFEKNFSESQKRKQNPKNIFLKIAPDLTESETEALYNSALKNKFTGIIATNTTIDKSGLDCDESEKGGISGAPLKNRSGYILNLLNEINKKNNNELFLIASGGVFDKKDFNEKINSGASLVQIYTGFIYEGPGIVKSILS